MSRPADASANAIILEMWPSRPCGRDCILNILEIVALSDELERVADAARSFAAPGEELAAVLPAAPRERRVYLCAFDCGRDETAWLALDEDGAPVTSRALVRDAVSIAALCEVAEDTAGGGDLEDLRSQLLSLRLRENPPGIEEAEEAALHLQRTLAGAPRVATAAYLDDVGAATRRLERALGEDAASPFAAAMQTAAGAVDALTAAVESNYKGDLD